MATYVRLDPAIEARVAQEAKRLGVTRSEFIKDAIEDALGLKNPLELLNLVSSSTPMGNPAHRRKSRAASM